MDPHHDQSRPRSLGSSQETDLQWRLAGERAEGSSAKFLASQLPGAEVKETPEATCFRTGFPGAGYNGVSVIGEPPEPDLLIREARGLCHGKTPWGLVVSETVLHQWGERFPRGELKEYQTQPAMILETVRKA